MALHLMETLFTNTCWMCGMARSVLTRWMETMIAKSLFRLSSCACPEMVTNDNGGGGTATIERSRGNRKHEHAATESDTKVADANFHINLDPQSLVPRRMS